MAEAEVIEALSECKESLGACAWQAVGPRQPQTYGLGGNLRRPPAPQPVELRTDRLPQLDELSTMTPEPTELAPMGFLAPSGQL